MANLQDGGIPPSPPTVLLPCGGATVRARIEPSKATLRQRLRAERNALSEERIRDLSASIARRVLGASFFDEARTIGLYLPFDHEVDPSLLIHETVGSGRLVFLPVVDGANRSMRFVPYQPGDPLQVGAYGIREPVVPPDGGQGLDTLDLDLLFQPLIGFDRAGGRLGFGGGYHDRALAARGEATHPLCVGLAYAFQELPFLPREPHDILMDWVVTERGVVACREYR
ncbi:5-formyltetrahydrofolate cyclo-ligase [Candidatus Magnetaquiglobus chichijimensis]|uniref:5-formyltetrahydrofolate cyclo-ligase n=1 Tax=Candidatus Magnetaquiglobus chichijimensis TaxID=3141448 RepID=UPI003B97A0B0